MKIKNPATKDNQLYCGCSGVYYLAETRRTVSYWNTFSVRVVKKKCMKLMPMETG